ncbi:hypothetical protein CEXT_138161 [Caerostris extrusa]|uniref:Uncharacterized protein n=1 Tax=Caerostris extrusa TaxID=172846 RepID=A0AAV4QN92_CAEEX|nr:hypothetical protein CEXT_138161 [Caerostris extrusa]
MTDLNLISGPPTIRNQSLLNQVGMESRLLVQLKACSNVHEHTFHIEEAPHHVETMGCLSHLMEHIEISLVEPDRYFIDYMQGGEKYGYTQQSEISEKITTFPSSAYLNNAVY